MRVRAVTDDGRVVAQGADDRLLWLPLGRRRAPSTSRDGARASRSWPAPPAGLVVTTVRTARRTWRELSDTGELTRIRDLPGHDDLVVSPGAATGWCGAPAAPWAARSSRSRRSRRRPSTAPSGPR